MNFYQCMRAMKITMLLLTCFLMQVSAHTFAQRISMNRQNSTIHAVLEDIRKQVKYDFFYDMDLFKQAKPVTLQVQDATLEEALNILFKGLPYSYSIDNKMVVITEAEKNVAVSISPRVVREQPGRIGGKVLDDRGQPLPGATVRILQRNQAVQSGVDGSYSFSVAPGSYTVEVSYISFQTRRITQVEVKEGQLTSLHITLAPSTKTLGQVVVTGSYKKESVAGLYARQKNAASVTDGISSEQIARTPDNDMGQVLKRVTGLTTVNNRNVIVRGMSDRYNQAMLDGVVIPSTSQNRRDFSFDIIPTEMVSSVVVNKTATPDVSAEFSGGQVSVNTIDIPEQNFTTIQYGLGGNSQTTGKDFYRLGKRHTSEFFGFFDQSSKMPEGIKTWQWNNRASQLDAPPGYHLTDPELNGTPLNSMEFGDNVKYNDLDAIAQSKKLNNDALKPYRYKAAPNQNMRLSLGRVYDFKNGNRFGFVTSVNVRNEQNIVQFNNLRSSTSGNYLDSTGMGDKGAGASYRFNSNAGLVANMGWQRKHFKVVLKNIYATTYSDNYNESVLTPHDDSQPIASKLVYQLPEAMSLQQHQLTGEYQLPWRIKAEGTLTVNKIRQQILDERKLSYRLTTIIGDVPYFQTPGLMTHSAASNGSAFQDWRMWTRIDETDYNWSAAFSRKFGEKKQVSTLLKFGYQAWTKRRSLDINKMAPWTRAWAAGTTNQKAPPIEISYDQLLSPGNMGNGDGQAYYYADALGGRFYDGRMASHALYLMADQKFGSKLRLVYGVRAEYFDLTSKQEELYRRSYRDEPDPDDVQKHRFGVRENNWRFLPSLNATYSLTPELNIRGSYSKTVIRPDFREIGMFGMYDFELNGYVYGEHVQSTLIDNMDLRFEWYPSPGEVLSLTGYYKKLDKPIELVHSEAANYTFANMENATNLGLELEIRKNLAFLSASDWAKNLFIYANGTLLKSKVNVLSHWQWINNPETQKAERVQQRYPNQDRPLIGQSPWLLNLGIGYWGDYFGATVSYNHRGPRTNLANVNMARVEYELAPRQLDAQLYARFLKKKMEVKLNLTNLLNDWTRYYMNIHDYVQDETKFDVLKAGKSIKYRKEDGDIITYRRKDGQRFSMSVSYNF
ncbi:Secretin and TonB N terminus short domain-containing protein [Chitinophaga eiseniae]|uniref:Secretin and TonB N terminus short domain-containing protein n=1 Tax=Chitinophaga eiseniae TaxID=634771 RepID=A0A1T4SYF1_9BACT|nr:TonB-dependent receptor [Chitinophaga eiseniae]SKA33276.1 Secretin and TonB N terminus short domain-containing protein [Chitinophaga eiseniae]